MSYYVFKSSAFAKTGEADAAREMARDDYGMRRVIRRRRVHSGGLIVAFCLRTEVAIPEFAMNLFNLRPLGDGDWRPQEA